ncbi:MAG: NUDIX domain-containing protein [Parachlamydiales bacterium]|jgi:8-oxo-dGTP pyrophosphatase MutT (NUDIX family)
MLVIKNQKGIFQLRTAGIVKKGEKILLLNEPHVSYWFLPGGRVEMHESTKETLERELLEEMNAKAEIGNLIWIIENFFPFNGAPFHEIGFYYEVKIPSDHPINSRDEFHFQREEDGKIKKFHFKWFSQNELLSMDIRPKCLKNKLLSDSKDFELIVYKEDSLENNLKDQ